MKKKIFFLAFLFFAIDLVLLSQTEDWFYNYNYSSGNYGDNPAKIAIDPSSGNIYLAGVTLTSTGSSGYVTIKFSPNSSTPVWVRNFFPLGSSNPNVGTMATGIDFDGNGNIYVTGEACYHEWNTQYYDVVTIKYNSSGDSLWGTRSDGPAGGIDYGRDLVIGNDGHVYVAVPYAVIGGWDFTMLKLDKDDGEEILTAYHDFDDVEDCRYIRKDSEGNLYLVGNVAPTAAMFTPSNNDYAIVSFDQDGKERWYDRYEGTGNGNDFPNHMFIDENDNIYVTGTSYGDGTGNDIVTIKYQPDGDREWVARYDGGFEGNDAGWNITGDYSGHIYITGSIHQYSEDKLVVIKYTTNSSSENWVKILEPLRTSNSIGASITMDNDGNICVFGSYLDVNATFTDFVTLKIDSNGDPVEGWSMLRDFGVSEITHYGGVTREKIVVDANDNLFVTGVANSTNNGEQFTVIKYIPEEENRPSFLNNTSKETPRVYNLSQNYPNPFNPVTNIKFGLPKAGFVNMTVYDVNGQAVSQVVNGYYGAGNYTVDFDASKLSSGIYFYTLKSNDFAETKKMILVK